MQNSIIAPKREGRDFDLIRINRSKATVDLAPNTIRSYGQRGLRLYKCGKALFFSKIELDEYIRANSTQEVRA